MNQSGRDSDIISESKYDEYKKLYDEQRKFDEEIETITEQTNMLIKVSIGLGTLSVVLVGIIIAILIKNKKRRKIEV